MGWNLAEIKSDALRRQLRAGFETVVARPSHPVVKRPVGATLEPSSPAQAGGADRLTVRITRHACRVLDADNFAGGCKYVIDALRHERIILNDDPASIRLAFEQVRVHRKKDEGVEIVIDRPAFIACK